MKNVFSAVTFVLRLIIFSIVSWIVIHLMAVAGFFITAAYPIWGLLAPASILCLFCKINQSKGYCSACKKKITNDFSPSSFRSIILNTVLIFIITLATIGVVYLEKEFVERVFGVSIQTKSVKIDVRSNRTIYQNRVSPVKLFLKGIKNSINAVQVDLDFNPDELEVLQFIEKIHLPIFLLRNKSITKSGLSALQEEYQVRDMKMILPMSDRCLCVQRS